MKRTMILSMIILMIVGAVASAKSIDQEEKVSIDGINTIRVDDTGIKSIGVVINNLRITINVFPESRNDVLVHLHGDATASNRKCLPVLEVDRSGDTLSIVLDRCEGLKFFVVSRGELTLDVHIPDTYDNAVDVSSSNSRVNIGAFTVADLRARVSSGSLTVDDCTAEDAELRASSGRIEIASCTADNLLVKSTSGRIEAGSLISDDGEVQASSGGIRIGELSGNFYVKASSGKIRVEKAEGEVTLNSSSGGVTIENASGDFEIDCSSGNVEVDFEGNRGSLRVDSSSGKIELMGLDGYAHLDSTSGRINAEFVRLTDDSSFEASSGGIDITLPEDQDFVLEARTSSGRIDLDFPITVEGRIDKKEVQGTVGSGGSLVKVKTSSGGVELRSR